MKIYKQLNPSDYSTALTRPTMDTSVLFDSVQAILTDIKQNGETAVRKYAEKFDKLVLDELKVTEEEFLAAENALSDDLKTAILTAKANIETFHQRQKGVVEVIETMQGVRCWRKSVGIDRVGLYIPGGTAPLFSTVLMLGVPAQIAGCQQIVLCSPPSPKESFQTVIDEKTGEKQIHPAVLFAAKACGITEVFKLGGVQAIGAMAYGAGSVPRVWKIFGPGNQYVTAAKQLVNTEGVAIDMPAGPSEVLVIADETANPDFVAIDLLSQAEHGVDSQVVLVAFSETIVNNVLQSIEKQLIELPRANLAQEALKNSVAIIVEDEEEAMQISNYYAPEHLILQVANADVLSEKVVNAGSVFIGHWSPESVGDYASGTNHTLPTNGYARAYSGVSVDSFVKKITFQRLDTEGVKNIGKTVVTMAEAEQLDAHARAVSIRLEQLH
ncbi:MAG: histidinol dehydrogenase [Saprospiraceae bacterium]|nr:histidinol dehydrogenase [Saprospiraceae bacterium]